MGVGTVAARSWNKGQGFNQLNLNFGDHFVLYIRPNIARFRCIGP